MQRRQPATDNKIIANPDDIGQQINDEPRLRPQIGQFCDSHSISFVCSLLVVGLGAFH